MSIENYCVKISSRNANNKSPFRLSKKIVNHDLDVTFSSKTPKQSRSKIHFDEKRISSIRKKLNDDLISDNIYNPNKEVLTIHKSKNRAKSRFLDHLTRGKSLLKQPVQTPNISERAPAMAAESCLKSYQTTKSVNFEGKIKINQFLNSNMTTLAKEEDSSLLQLHKKQSCEFRQQLASTPVSPKQMGEQPIQLP